MYLLGIDLGTSSAKTLVWDAEQGTALASVTHEYPVNQPQPGYAEQDPADWWRAVISTVHAAVAQAGQRVLFCQIIYQYGSATILAE